MATYVGVPRPQPLLHRDGEICSTCSTCCTPWHTLFVPRCTSTTSWVSHEENIQNKCRIWNEMHICVINPIGLCSVRLELILLYRPRPGFISLTSCSIDGCGISRPPPLADTCLTCPALWWMAASVCDMCVFATSARPLPRRTWSRPPTSSRRSSSSCPSTASVTPSSRSSATSCLPTSTRASASTATRSRSASTCSAGTGWRWRYKAPSSSPSRSGSTSPSTPSSQGQGHVLIQTHTYMPRSGPRVDTNSHLHAKVRAACWYKLTPTCQGQGRVLIQTHTYMPPMSGPRVDTNSPHTHTRHS